MKELYNKMLAFINNVKSKIAFYPTLLALAGFLLSFVMAALEKQDVSKKLIETIPQLVLEDGDTALTVLSACIGGLISVMVFSFSMVMLLLSQASSNFSPRLLPGLISDKTHQVVLGTYLATILYNIFTLFSIEPNDEKYTLPGLSILLGIILTILCLCMFIYFIHNISQSIQINNILDSIYEKSKKRLTILLKQEKEENKTTVESFPSSDKWKEYTTKESGYLQNISYKNIIKIAIEKETRIHITIPKGFFVLQHVPLLKSEKELDEETLHKILSNINFSRGELVEDNYILAFKQITEIAVKAMSPGINDPGTAINAIDYLTELFALRMQKRDCGIFINDEKAVIKNAVIPFEDLLYNSMASLRTYCKHDPIIVQKLIWMLQYLEKIDAYKNAYKKNVTHELENLIKDAVASFDSEEDIKKIKSYID
ncbi:DUF2254 domain-containing protein [Marixanthomonas sp. SCSIO 43207]|uniref:DUF2254 domain-containing protein n=1 Tax=Marixanthomonas sp. SCSIO 43207 TaxID=2779360 RepID=UPI001CA81A2E|nr:DUF2254 domain-containing protein [Marixanthomonas sp. SCSIO 43207]UAB81098.1 DUF2254 domain-containing protein [Marixanthomonas sp. SCSIO 43207]